MYICIAFLTALFAAEAHAANSITQRDDSSSVWNTTSCATSDLQIIKEWRNLTSSEKSAYIAAEKCLWELPANTSFDGVVNRHDDLTAVHQYLTPVIHAVGQFLPWHRLFMKTHEHLMRTECNYTGPMTWWDETQDAGDYINSPILDPDTGFGGNGTGADQCVTDGPFANSTLTVGPNTTYTPEGYCLKRHVNETFSAGAAADIIATCDNLTDYADAGIWCIGASPHTAGHGGVGGGVSGSIGDIYVSPGDPLFYLHHAFIDRLWWQWQNEDIDTRLYEIGGYTTYPASDGGNTTTTLEFGLQLLGVWDDKVVGDVMDLHNSFLCHEYDY
ncbi:hypothetical protein SLS64_007504 [Diaporthe eres]|uniref:Tyrosinase copper-binding domain-containing protein n=1 Tax=Diaporthe eres TaxID=83184 RepID=A0ABR1NRQ1_DIAER